MQISALKSREPTESINLNKETEGSCSNRSENSSDIKLDISRTPAIDSPLSNHPISRPFFPSSSIRPTGVAQLFHNNSSRSDHIHCQKNIDQMVKEETLSNMFCGIDDQSGFWPWLEQQHFNWDTTPTTTLYPVWRSFSNHHQRATTLFLQVHVLVLRLLYKLGFISSLRLVGGAEHHRLRAIKEFVSLSYIPCFS